MKITRLQAVAIVGAIGTLAAATASALNTPTSDAISAAALAAVTVIVKVIDDAFPGSKVQADADELLASATAIAPLVAPMVEAAVRGDKK